jgi:REP element-mobilizing transposase RayT
MTLFNNKYRIESARLKGYDYSSPGEYFVTICTGGMIHPVRYIKLQNHHRIKKTISQGKYFGDVMDGEMKRNDVGVIARQMWMDIPNHHKYVSIDEFVVMPNHVHGIIVLCENDHGKNVAHGRDVACNVSTRISPKRESLSTIIRSYKSGVSNWCHANGYEDFSWQSRFYDHIIRDEKGLNAIREYIHNNPAQWEYDRNDPSGLYNWKPND